MTMSESKRDENAFFERCEEGRRLAFSFKSPLIVHHYDADGLSSGALVCAAFIEKNKKYRMRCIKKFDDATVDSLMNEEEIIFVDLGGGNPRVNELRDVVIIDHHQTQGVDKLQVNPMLFGIDGGSEISAAGTAYSMFKVRSDLAIVGALGDMQAPLIGMNKEIAQEAVKRGEIRIEHDLCFYGRYSRPLTQFILYSDDPYIPGLSYKEDRVNALFQDLAIPLKEGEHWRKYCDLSKNEKTKLISALVSILAEKTETKITQKLVAETYVLPKQKYGSETYEANEFSTILNACGRHERPEIGIRICLGDEKALVEGRALLQYHRTKLKEGVLFASQKMQDFGKFYFVDARGVIDEGIIGTVCGMLIRPGMKKPLFGVSLGDKQTLKWSVRYPKFLKGNMGLVIKHAAAECGGIGGGHRIAAGASIPKDKINEFLVALGREIDKQEH